MIDSKFIGKKGNPAYVVFPDAPWQFAFMDNDLLVVELFVVAQVINPSWYGFRVIGCFQGGHHPLSLVDFGLVFFLICGCVVSIFQVRLHVVRPSLDFLFTCR